MFLWKCSSLVVGRVWLSGLDSGSSIRLVWCVIRLSCCLVMLLSVCLLYSIRIRLFGCSILWVWCRVRLNSLLGCLVGVLCSL